MSISLRVTDCWTIHMPLSEKLPVISLMIFISYSLLGHSTRRKIQILLDISPLLSTHNFLFLVDMMITSHSSRLLGWCVLCMPPFCRQSPNPRCCWSLPSWIETTKMIVLNQQFLSLAVQVIWDHTHASNIYVLLPWWDCLLSWLSETNLSFWLSKFCLEWHQVKRLFPGWELFLPLPHNCSLGIYKAMRCAAMLRWKLELKGFIEHRRE